MMKNIALFVLLVAVVGLVVRDRSNCADLAAANQETLKATRETVRAEQEVAELMEHRIWAESQIANTPIPKKYKDDFIQLLRFILTKEESEEAVAQNACVEFRNRVFPASTDDEAYSWAFTVKGMEDLAEQYKLLSVKIARLE